ncbi:MAG: tryptophan-rich sensory protein [Candidatus Bathyarchaeota archaeon]|nr:tryptophan-rich sensory protein [Candidatus Bathyarchaeota archaeon]
MQKYSTTLIYANIVAYIFTILINSLAGSTMLIGGQNTAAISDNNPTLITPAGYVFSIWGIIYVLLGAFVIYQALPRERKSAYHQKIGWLFLLSSLFNIAWIFVWQYESLILSVILIFALLFSLIAIYMRLNIGRSKVRTSERLAVHLPFSVYLGWITIASIADVAVTLTAYNWDGFGISPEIWATIVVAVALVITLLMLGIRKDVAYALVVIWALVGIGMNNSGNQTVMLLTQIGSIIVGVAIIVVVIITLLRRKKKSPATEID